MAGPLSQHALCWLVDALNNTLGYPLRDGYITSHVWRCPKAAFDGQPTYHHGWYTELHPRLDLEVASCVLYAVAIKGPRRRGLTFQYGRHLQMATSQHFPGIHIIQLLCAVRIQRHFPSLIDVVGSLRWDTRVSEPSLLFSGIVALTRV